MPQGEIPKMTIKSLAELEDPKVRAQFIAESLKGNSARTEEDHFGKNDGLTSDETQDWWKNAKW
jgi:hypothetical protein